MHLFKQSKSGHIKSYNSSLYLNILLYLRFSELLSRSPLHYKYLLESDMSSELLMLIAHRKLYCYLQ